MPKTATAANPRKEPAASADLLAIEPPRPDLAALERVEVTDDVVQFAFECVMALAPGFSRAVIEAAERHVRETYGNQEVWIRLRRDLQRRNAQIVREYLAGERVQYLARKYELTERHVLRIVKAKG